MSPLTLPNIGILGEAKHGKDTLAAFILADNPQFIRRAFADALKFQVGELVGESLSDDDATDYPRPESIALPYPAYSTREHVFRNEMAYDDAVIAWVNAHKDEPVMRSMLQAYGVYQRGYVRPTIWVDTLFDWFTAAYHNLPGVKNLVVPDVRFPNEVETLRERGFFLVKVVRPNFDNGLTSEQKQHVSETHTATLMPDLTILNDGTPMDMYERFLDHFNARTGDAVLAQASDD